MRCFYFAILVLCLAISAKAQECLPGTECESAPYFCGYAFENKLFINIESCWHTSTPPSCIQALHNSNWFRIVPCDVELNLMINVENCNGSSGLQAALFDECGPNANVLDCYSGGIASTFFINAIVEPGRPYLLQIDGNEGDICEYGILVLSGLDMSPPPLNIANGAITGATGGHCNGSGSIPATFSASWQGCGDFENGVICYSAPPDSCNGVQWTFPPGALILGNPNANLVTVSFQNVLAGTYLIKAKRAVCPDIMCPDCYCPVEELTMEITIGGSCNYDCEDFNVPAPPGDDCSEAPFLCGNYLDGYCSSNAGLDTDNLGGSLLRNSGFLRLAPCEASDSIHLRLRVRDCTQGNRLVFHLVRDACGTPVFISSITVLNGATADFFVDNLVPGTTYYLVFEGGSFFSICEFFIEVIAGIGTASPGSGSIVDCNCTDATIGGPDELCPGDIANFFIASPGFCLPTISPDPNPSPGPNTRLGNGYFCCPESGDSMRIVWHIPSAMNFLSDSVGVNTITVQVDTNLLGIDTLIMDSVWFSFEPVNSGPLDTLVFCDPCQGCFPGVQPKPVTIRHEVEFYTCFLDCYDPFCQIGTRVFFNEVQDTFSSSCLTEIVWVFDDRSPPFGLITPAQPVLTCNFPAIALTATPFQSNLSSVAFSWTGPGIASAANAQTIFVDEPGLYSCLITNLHNGCTATASKMVFRDIFPPVAIASADVTICIGQTTNLNSTGSSSGGQYAYTWSSPTATFSGPNLSVSPATTTQYELEVSNVINGCSSIDVVVVTVIPPDTLELGLVGIITCQQPCVNYLGNDYCTPGVYMVQTSPCEISRFTIGEDLTIPTVNLPVVFLCEGQCYQFYGQEYCFSELVMQEDNCTNFVQQIIVITPDTMELGLVGEITCVQPCVSYLGDEYCAPGEYLVPTGFCEISRFTIGENLNLPTVTLPVVALCLGECHSFYGQEYCTTTTVSQEENCTIFIQEIIVNAPDTLELGLVGAITCMQPCVNYQGTDYCAPGTYTLQLSPCEIGRFIIEEDSALPTVTLPVVTLCEGQCYEFYGQEYCTTTTVFQEENCTIFVQEIIVNPPAIVQAGLIGNMSCGATCIDYLGGTYCDPGQYVDTGACVLTYFEIGFVRDTLQLGQIGTISCQQPCVSFMQDLYCTPGNYTVEDFCTVFHFSVGGNQAAPGTSNPNLHCLPDNHQYTVSFTITGTPPYKVNGENITGSYFTSAPYANGAPYAFVIEQVNNGCQTVVNGAHDCSFMCSGNPGGMLPEGLDVCIGSTVQAFPETLPQPAPGQVVRYLLHTQPGTTPGTILAENADGVFSFDPATMVAEVTYYLSCGIGTLAANGALDFANLCTRIAPGQPVIFHAPPRFVDILVENPTCFGANDGALNVLFADGSPPLTYALDGGPFGSTTLFGGLTAGAYDLALRDVYGCQTDTSLTLTEPDSVWLSLGPDRDVIRGEKVLLQPQTNITGPAFAWSNNQNTAVHQGPDWLVQPALTTLYNCVAQDANGCAATASVLLTIKSGSVYYPNVLSRGSQEPANRNFTLFAREGYIQQINSLKIFDRWGGLAFQRNFFSPNLPELGWDGAVDGQPVNSGVFVFVAEVLLFDGSVEVVKGDVTVL